MSHVFIVLLRKTDEQAQHQFNREIKRMYQTKKDHKLFHSTIIGFEESLNLPSLDPDECRTYIAADFSTR